MTNDMQPVATTPEYGALLGRLAALSRDLLLAFRLEVGKLMLDEYFGGSAHAYHDQDPYKVSSFLQFTKNCQDELADFGLTAVVLRQCIQARIAWDGLPPGVREKLQFSHVVMLARVDEPNARARLAFDATEQKWNVTQLRDAIARNEDGQYYDVDPITPGTQPPPLPESAAAASFQPGRLVTQLVKTGKGIEAWRQSWATVDATKLRAAERQRVSQALAQLKDQVARLEVELAANDD